jgi:hypothetical protein
MADKEEQDVSGRIKMMLANFKEKHIARRTSSHCSKGDMGQHGDGRWDW